MVGIGDLFLPPLSTVQLPHYDIGRLSALHIIHGDNHRETRKVASPWLPRFDNDYRCCATFSPAIRLRSMCSRVTFLVSGISQKVMPIKATLSAV